MLIKGDGGKDIVKRERVACVETVKGNKVGVV